VDPARPTAPVEGTHAADPVTQALFEALRRHRLTLAREEAVPPYVIASDRTLRELAEIRPRTLDALRLAHGIGDRKVERYGVGLLAVVARTLGDTAAARP
jgi:ATP-dependent DNA helicase RecQ